MNKPIILITDTTFINPTQELLLKKAGYKIERLPKLKPTEQELVHAVKGKTGYIIGGIEEITSPVIEAADTLEGIVYTGIDYKPAIPAREKAYVKGIIIENTPEGPTQPTAEWAFGAALIMQRRMIELGNTGNLSGLTTPGLQSQKIGIIGYGRIGKTIAKMVKPFKPRSADYYSRHESSISLSRLLKESDIIFLCVPWENNKNFLGKKEVSMIKNDALLVTISNPEVVDEKALFERLSQASLRIASSHPMGGKFNKLPLKNWYCSNDAFASNTFSGLELTGELAVKKMLGILNKA